jgi:hypothetical protein
MSILDWLFGTSKLPEHVQAATAVKEPELRAEDIPVHYEAAPGTLELGWYFSDASQQIQMAKVDQEDRTTHTYVIGASGSGKTKFLEFLIHQDILDRNGFAVIDPHGDLVEDIKGALAIYADIYGSEALEHVVVLDPTDPERTVGFNPLEQLPGVSVSEQAQELISTFRKIWADSWGARMEDLLRSSLIALGEAELTLVELPRFLTSQSYRKGVLTQVSHPVVLQYFQRFDAMTERSRLTWIEPVTNKINALLADERVGQLLASPHSTFGLRDVMDSGKILLVKLDKGRLRDSADLLGSLILAKIKMAAFSRSDVPPRQRRQFHLYIDEFQNFASDSFGVMLSESRKYGLSLIMAHQTLSQAPPDLRQLVLGNTGLQVYFRVSHQDAGLLAKEGFVYSPNQVKSSGASGVSYQSASEQRQHLAQDIQDLPPRVCFAKHKIEGGLVMLRTVDIEDAEDVLGLDEVEYPRYLKNLGIGRRYTVDRQRLTEEINQRVQDLDVPAPAPEPESVSTERGKIETSKTKAEPRETDSSEPGQTIQESARPQRSKADDVQTEAADSPPVTPETPEPSPPAPKSKKASKRREKASQEPPVAIPDESMREEIYALTSNKPSQHRYLQSLIKRIAQDKGFRVNLEEETPTKDGRVDVGLERNGKRIACEVSVTTGEDHELSNIRKCLRAGYDTVIMCSQERKTVDKVQRLAGKELSADELERVRFFQPDDLFFYLDEEAAREASREERVKGYKVKVEYKPTAEKEKKERREAVGQVIAQALGRIKKNDQ